MKTHTNYYYDVKSENMSTFSYLFFVVIKEEVQSMLLSPAKVTQTFAFRKIELTKRD